MNAEINSAKTTFGLTNEQADLYKRFFENYGLLTDEQVTSLEDLETQQISQRDELKENNKLYMRHSELLLKGVVDVEANTEQTSKYNKMVSELSKTLGFDVLPIMSAIIRTNEDQRDSITDSIVA